MKKILLLLLTVNIYASKPTVEGLFRNSLNPEIDKEVIVLTMRATLEDKEIVTEEQNAQEQSSAIDESKYYKYIIENKAGGKLIAVRYGDREMNNENAEAVKVINDYKEIIENKNIITDLVNSSILMFAKNSSYGFGQVFKKLSINFMLNSEILNEDKKQLLDEYKQYLVRKKEYEKKIEEEKKKPEEKVYTSETSEEVFLSPMLPDEEEEKKRIKELVDSSMYKKSDSLKLIKSGRNFYWELDLGQITGRFTNETHEIKYLNIQKDDKNYNVIFDKPVTYAGIYSIPKGFTIQEGNKSLKLEIIKMYAVTSKKKTFNERVDDYNKVAESISSKQEKDKKPEFEQGGNKSETEKSDAQKVTKVKIETLIF